MDLYLYLDKMIAVGFRSHPKFGSFGDLNLVLWSELGLRSSP